MERARLSAAYPVLKAVLFCILFTGLFALLSFLKSFLPAQAERFAHGIIGIAAAFITAYAFAHFDGKSLRDIGLRFERQTPQKFFLGVGVGLGLAATMFACLLAFGRLRLQPRQLFSVPRFLLSTLAFVPLAFLEEVAFRAYPLLTLRQRLGVWPTLLVSSTLFALYHVANGWSLSLSFVGPGVWGLVYGLAALYAKGIAMPTGIHYAANLAQAAVGMSAGFMPLWTMRLQDETASTGAEFVGLGVQLCLLTTAVAGIEWFRRTGAATAGTRLS